MTWENPDPEPEFQLPLSAEEDTRPELTTAEEPLEVWVPKELLQQAVEENLGSMLERRTILEVSLESIEVAEQLLAQRREFLAWLENYPLDHVYLQMFPPRFAEEVYGEE